MSELFSQIAKATASSDSTLVDHPFRAEDEDDDQADIQTNSENDEGGDAQHDEDDEEEPILDATTLRQLHITWKSWHTRHLNNITSTIQIRDNNSVLRYIQGQISDLHDDC